MSDESNLLGEYLRARRELVDPSDHGIVDVGRRRVKGLRREELAFLAGISAPYYARLEQGRDRFPSRSILDAVAAVLRLDADEIEHLYRLADPPSSRRRAVPPAAERVSPVVLGMLDALAGQAAIVIGRYRDVLASNDLAVALNPGFAAGRNLLRDTFLDPASRRLYPDWEEVATASVAGLRASARVGDERLDALVEDMEGRSPEFASLWARHDVHPKTFGVKRHLHPDVGALDLDYQTFEVNGFEGQSLQVFSAPVDSAAQAALAILAAQPRRAGSGAGTR